MQPAERGDEYYPVDCAEDDYDRLIKAINAAPPENYRFADDALEVRDRVMDDLHKLETVGGFSPALIGAVGKLRGYFARICLVLHVGRRHDQRASPERLQEVCLDPELFSPERAEELCKIFGVDPKDDHLGGGIHPNTMISRATAEPLRS
jgi:hypothetical protein